MPTLKERELVKFNKKLITSERRQEALSTAMETAKASHRKILSKILREETEVAGRHENRIKSLEVDLKWEGALLRPLHLHIMDIGEAWLSSQCSKAAVSHLSEIRSFTEKMIALYEKDESPDELKKGLVNLIEHAPTTLIPDEASPFYPYLDKREEVSNTIWETLLKELNCPKVQKRYEDGVYEFSGFVQMFHEIAIAASAPLNGSLLTMNNAMDAECVDRKQVEALSDFIYKCQDEYEGEYKENKAMKRAWLQSQKLSKETINTPSARSGPRL